MDYEQDDDDMPVFDEETLELKQMFIDRDNDYIDATQEIVDTIGPTLLEALYRLFGVPVDDVRWLDFASSETIMIITCGIAYNPSVSIPKFISDTQHIIPKVSIKFEQTVRIGVPYELVLADPDEILDFMSALIRSHIDGGPTLIEHLEQETVEQQPQFDDAELVEHRQGRAVDVGEFNPSELTNEQKQQMLIFQHQTKGKLH